MIEMEADRLFWLLKLLVLPLSRLRDGEEQESEEEARDAREQVDRPPSQVEKIGTGEVDAKGLGEAEA